MAGQSREPGAQRAANGDFAAASFGARQQQVRYVDARDEQHESNRGEQHQQRRPHAADDFALQWKADQRVIRGIEIMFVLAFVLRAERSLVCFEFGLRLRCGDAGFQASEQIQVMRAATAGLCRIDLQRGPHLRRVNLSRREFKASGHHADDRGWLAVQIRFLAENVFVAAEGALPQSVGNVRDHRG